MVQRLCAHPESEWVTFAKVSTHVLTSLCKDALRVCHAAEAEAACGGGLVETS